MRVSALIIGLAICLTPSLAQADALNWANGSWGLDKFDGDTDYNDRNCKDSPVTIRVNAEDKTYWSKIGDEEPRTAIITDVSEHGFTLKYDNETRHMSDGQLHIWSLHFVDEDSFYWVRDDWKAKGPTHKTAKRYRCRLEMS